MAKPKRGKPKTKDPAAVALGRKRWASVDKAERRQAMTDLIRRRWNRKGATS